MAMGDERAGLDLSGKQSEPVCVCVCVPATASPAFGTYERKKRACLRDAAAAAAAGLGGGAELFVLFSMWMWMWVGDPAIPAQRRKRGEKGEIGREKRKDEVVGSFRNQPASFFLSFFLASFSSLFLTSFHLFSHFSFPRPPSHASRDPTSTRLASFRSSVLQKGNESVKIKRLVGLTVRIARCSIPASFYACMRGVSVCVFAVCTGQRGNSFIFSLLPPPLSSSRFI
jgi:hypothetical protein